MSQNLVLKASGIHTNNNPLSSTPNGSMSDAVNVVIDKSEIVEPRRGFFQYSDALGGLAKQLINYKDRVLAHVSTQLRYDSDAEGDFEAFSGDSVSQIDTTIRLKSIESNGNLYFTSLTGVKKISARTADDFSVVTIESAGGIKAVDLEVNTNYSALGFLEPDSKCAYRLVFGITDLNDNLILGSPSSRTVVYNVSATQSCITTLNFTLPSTITANHFYQIYRTGLSTDIAAEPTDPGEEMYLVLEDQITAADVIAGTITVNDITPDDFRRNGALLYTNPVSGEGITQSNEPPPFAKDICLYKGFTFLGNTKTVQRLNTAFLTVSGAVSDTTNFKILASGYTTETYVFRGTSDSFTLNYAGTVAANFVNAAVATARYFTLISARDERKYYVWFNDGTATGAIPNNTNPALSGYIGIEVTVVTADSPDVKMAAAKLAIETATDDFNITLNTGTDVMVATCSDNGAVATAAAENITSFTNTKAGTGTGEDSATYKVLLPRIPSTTEVGPTTSQQLEEVAKSLVSVINEKSLIVNAYYSSGFNDVPGQIMLEQKATTGAAFYLNSNLGSIFNPTIPASGTDVISSNEVRPNRIYYSKYQQPDAYPLVNYIDIGPKDREIKRIIALRDSLFVLKEDGIYKVTGDTAVAGNSNFSVNEFDFSAQVLAPDTAVVLNNTIYALSTQGVITISDTGVSVISRPIENQVLRILRDGSSYKTASFGVAYESDRSYLLFTVTTNADTVSTQVYRYNSFTNTWTRWDISKTCGIVNFADDKLYLGAADLNIIEKERKSLTRTDHADREYSVQIQLNGVSSTSAVELNSLTNAQVGDVLLQRQYLTRSVFNRLLNKLDLDVLVATNDFFSTLEYTRGKNIRSSLVDLSQKLVADIGGATDYEGLIDDYTETITANTAATQTVITLGAHDIEPTRYVTISGSNSTPSIDGTWEVVAADATTITIDKLVTVAGTTGTVQTAVQGFLDIQACFNLIVSGLNADPNVFFSNYQESEGYTDFEAVITSRDVTNAIITVTSTQDFLFGEAYILDAIETTIIYNPQFFGDPSVEKQVREGTFIFENSNFSSVTVAYSSDRSPAFVEIEFNGAGNGDFGQFGFGGVNFGGVAAPIPLRTYIPMTKQRCRFINIKFNHNVALEKYALYGVSLTYRPYNIKTNK